MKIQVRFHRRVFENCLYKILDKIMTSHGSSNLYTTLRSIIFNRNSNIKTRSDLNKIKFRPPVSDFQVIV